MRKNAATFALVCVAIIGCASNGPEVRRGDNHQTLRHQLESADLALREARLMDAEVLYRDLSASHPRLPEVWLQLGNIYARQSQLEAAMRCYKDGLVFSPEDGRLWHNLALVELRQSIRTLEAAAQLLPAGSPYRGRLNELHRALLLSGQVGTGADR